MKRKLSALLAIVLAVVMVFPTAVFVGAAVESAANMIATISGTIDDAGKQLDPIQVKYVDTKMTQSVNLAYDDEADLKVVLDEVYANFSIDKKTDNGVVWIEGTGSDYKIVTGDSVPRGTAYETFDFVADKLKTNKDGSLYKDKNGNTVVETEDVVFLTLTVNVKPIEIVEIDIYGYGVVNHTEEIVLDGDEKFNSKDELTLTKVHVVYNNATEEDIAITDKNLEITVDCVYPDKTTDELNEEDLEYRNNKFALRGDYMQLNYTYTGKYGMHNVSKSGSVELSVTSTGVIDVTPIRVTGDPINNITNMTEDGFLSRLNVSVRYKELNVPVIYTKVNATNNKIPGEDFTVRYYEDSAYKHEISFADIKNTNSYDAYFTITVEDQIFKSGNDANGNYTVQKYFDVKEKIPREITINWDKAVNKTYNEGYRIGTEDKDWSGVVVNVWYDQDTTPTTYTALADIAALDIILSPTVANQKFVTIESVLGEPIGSASNLPTGFNIIPREVVGITLPQTTLNYNEGENLDLTGIKATLKYNSVKIPRELSPMMNLPVAPRMVRN